MGYERGKWRLQLPAEARQRTGLFIIPEVITPADVPLNTDYADILYIGARNMQNFSPLKEVGDVPVTENMFGDILSDEAGVLAGSLGMLPCASLRVDGPGVYEPVHGSAPDLAGSGKANPTGAVLSAALLLRHSLGLVEEAAVLEHAVDRVLSEGGCAADLGGTFITMEMTQAVVDCL